MEQQILELLNELVSGRNGFFNNTFRTMNHRDRMVAFSRYMTNESSYLDLTSRVYYNFIRNQLATNILTLTMPQTFLDPVPVVPTQRQIENAIEPIESSTSNCAICQDSISLSGVRIRHCGHAYHRSCLMSWFSMNVRCPICRHDVRSNNPQEGRAVQRPVASAQTSSQPVTQSGETNISADDLIAHTGLDETSDGYHADTRE